MAKYGQKAEVIDRRIQVAEMLHRQIPQHEMIKALAKRGFHVDSPTISRDVKAILKVWSDDLEDAAKKLRARGARALDHLEMVAQANMENALKKRQQVEDSDQGNQKSVAWERYDRAVRAWFDERIKIQRQRAELLNLNLQQPPASTTLQQNIAFIFEKRPENLPLPGGNGHPIDVIDGELVDDGQ